MAGTLAAFLAIQVRRLKPCTCTQTPVLSSTRQSPPLVLQLCRVLLRNASDFFQ